MRTRTARWTLLLASAVFATTSGAHATQHLIGHGERWERLQDSLKPGDEVILMAGRHHPAVLESLHGTAEKPIVIRGLDPENPPTITADRYGIRLTDPRHVQISNIIITGASIHGISLEGTPASEREEGAVPAGSVTITDVTINETGPEGLRHAINVRHLANVRIEQCKVNGWAGSGVEVVACENVNVRRCAFIGVETFGQTSGIRVRGGSDRVTIDRCRFENPGMESVCVGGGSKLEEFRVPVPEDAEPGSQFEASRVWITRCVSRGGACAYSFVQCSRSTVRQCTISKPEEAVLSIRREQADPRFGDAKGCAFGGNLIAWGKDELTSLAHFGDGIDTAPINLEDNLWWTPDWSTAQERLGGFPGTAQFPQITEVDPALDAGLRPTVAAAESFGAYAE